MKITIEPDLCTAIDYFFANPSKTFKNQNNCTNFLKIPLQQRDFDWGNKDEDGSCIEGLLEDLDYHINESQDIYFAGTVLLENQNADYLKLIDGQQRITTLFLLNYAGYLISRYRIEKMPTFPNPVMYAIQFNKRFESFIKYERRAFISSINATVDNLINIDGDNESNKELLKRLGKSKSPDLDYWQQTISRLQFDDPEINAKFSETLKKSSLTINNGRPEIKSSSGAYANGLNIILDYLLETIYQGSLDEDQYLCELLNKIDRYLNNCGLASIISEDENDSFRLFEILNDRGQDLSALDLIKNIILEKSKQNNVTLTDFTKKWKKLKENVSKSFTKGKSDSIFVENIIRSEGCTLKNKEISYLSNKQTKEKRSDIFRNESIQDFFQRLLSTSLILRELHENTITDKTNNTDPFSRYPMSAFQYATFMKLINYNWGPQIIIASNLNYLIANKYQLSLNIGSNPDWKNKNSNPTVNDLNHFTRFLADITLKLGLLGIVNGLATKNLPTISKEITNLIIGNIEKNSIDFNTPAKLEKLKNEILGILSRDLFTPANYNLFETKLAKTYIANTGPKKNIIKILLYFIYNKGGVIYNLNYPELEHLEPQNPIANTSPYYQNTDRQEVINMLGNFALISKDTNTNDFSNKPLIEKIRIATTDPKLTSNPLFQNDLFKNINLASPLANSSIYGHMPVIKKAKTSISSPDDSFDSNGVPLRYFFEQRSTFLAKLAREIVCNTSRFLGSTENY
jgi:hypothetical protein